MDFPLIVYIILEIPNQNPEQEFQISESDLVSAINKP